MLSKLTTRHWMICAVVLLVIGIVMGIGGCIIAAVGFGLSAKDMYDYMNLSMRVTGMLLVFMSLLPLAVSTCCWVFYSWSKRDGKKTANPQTYVISTQGAVPMTQYPYPTSGATDTRIYRPQQPPRYANMDPDDSTAPLNYSDSTSRYPPDTSSPQVITSASSFDEDPSAAKVRQPKKGKKKGGSGVASEKEKEAMMSVGYSSAAGSSYRT